MAIDHLGLTAPGVALVVLRRYEDAVADGDDIKAVILASAVNNDGSGKASYLAPSVDGQAEAAAEALALSGLSPGDISYIETHGTGTPIGDPIELAALQQVYGGVQKAGRRTRPPQPLPDDRRTDPPRIGRAQRRAAGVAELARAEAAFLTNSLIGVRAVRSLDGFAWEPSPLVERLAAAVRG